MAGDELYDDDVTSGPIEPRLLCTCSKRRDDDEWERHAEDCRYRLAMGAIMRDGYPA